jgi:hypothetical protein
MNENPLWYGYLEAGEKSTPVLIDRKLETGKSETVYVFNLARKQILEYNRGIVEPKLRELRPDEADLIAELKAGYGQIRREFKPRVGRPLNIPEKQPTLRQAAEEEDIGMEEEEEFEALVGADADPADEEAEWTDEDDG